MTHPLKGLIVGIANENSIAWGCAQALQTMGATLAVTYLDDNARSFVPPLADQINADMVMPMDVTDERQMDEVFKRIKERWGKLDFVLHSISFGPSPDIFGRFIDCSSTSFTTAMDVSCHSLVRLAKRAEPLMSEGGSILTMSYHGSEKVMPHYSLMGPVKAALESSVRYLAWELGPSNIRVNALSAGPVRSGLENEIGHFDQMMSEASQKTPLGRPVTIEQIGDTAAFILSGRASAISGQTIYVDNGYSAVA